MDAPGLAAGCWLIFANLVGFGLMGIDKSRAVNGRRRFREATLHRVSAAGGAFGVIAGSSAFHHKTEKDSFAAITYALAMCWVLALVLLRRALGT